MTPSRNNGHPRCLRPEGAAHAPLKIEARGSKPALRGCFWSPNYMFWDARLALGGVTRTTPARSRRRAQRRSRRQFLTVLHFVFVFSLGRPTLSEAAGGRPQTERSSKTLGLCERRPGAAPFGNGLHSKRRSLDT